MTRDLSDTIAAIATGAGRAGIGIVRVSGPQAPAIGKAVTGLDLRARQAHYGPFTGANGEVVDVGIALQFAAPHSYTGEHVLELQGHGGPVVLDCVMQAVCALGARPARPGEFSERAFLNDKLDLAQAEAVADLIDASSEGAAKAAIRAISGDMSRDVDAIVDELIALRVWLEAALDFSEEEIDFLADASLAARASALVEAFDRVLARARQGQRLRDGLTVVIAGRPNVGKSSLLNALAQADSAIVTDVAGTTRDVLREDILIRDIPIRIVDTAGLRATLDAVEQIGIERAMQAASTADHVLLVLDASDPQWPDEPLPANIPVTVVLNKIDLVSAGDELSSQSDEQPGLKISVTRGEGLDQLRDHLGSLAGRDASIEGVYLARRRHIVALQEARTATEVALERLQSNDLPELAAEELRAAQRALESITGRFDADDLLGAIFGSFCIGK
jgi:tRNA modification GTPase